jgi:DNA polymerase sigma
MYTQAELNAAAAAARKADKDRLKDLEAKAARADELEAEKLSATERAEKAAADALARAEAAEKALEAANLAALRSSIGTKHGLTPLQASRLVGATEEEIEADAVAFAADLPKQDAPGARPGGETAVEEDPIRRAFLGLK